MIPKLYGIYIIAKDHIHTPFDQLPPARHQFTAWTHTRASTAGLIWINANRVIYTTYEIREIQR